MIPRASDKVYNRNSQHPHEPRNLACWNQKWRQCRLLSFDIKGVVHFEFIQQGHTVNQAYYIEILKLCLEKAWTLAQQLDSQPWQCSRLQGTISLKQFLIQKLIT